MQALQGQYSANRDGSRRRTGVVQGFVGRSQVNSTTGNHIFSGTYFFISIVLKIINAIFHPLLHFEGFCNAFSVHAFCCADCIVKDDGNQ